MQFIVRRDGRTRIAWAAYVIFLAAVADRYVFLANGWSPARAVFGSMFVLMHLVGLAALCVAIYFLPGRSWSSFAKWVVLIATPFIVALGAHPWFSAKHMAVLTERACSWVVRQPDLGAHVKVAVVLSNWKDEDIFVDGELRSALVRVNLFALGDEVTPLYPSNAELERQRSKAVSWAPCNEPKH